MKRSGKRMAKCDAAAVQSRIGRFYFLIIFFIDKYNNLKTDSSSGKTAFVLMILRKERFKDSIALVV